MVDVLSTYQDLLRKPGAKAFAFAGLLSRLPISMFNIGVILMVQIQYDSWEIAGRVAAIGVVVWAIQTVPTARLTDRLGQTAVMWPLTVLFVVGSVVLVITAMQNGPEPWLWAGAAIASFSGPLGSLTRARWSHILKKDSEIHTAFALEGSLDEILFVGGPALVTWMAYNVHPASGVTMAAIGMTVGIAILLSQRSTEPPPRHDADGTGLGWRVPKAVLAVALTAVALGSMFGALDISTVAFAKEQGHESWGGLILGVLSLGSFLGGLAYGAHRWKTTLWKRLVISATLLAIMFAILGQITHLGVFAAVGFFAGMTIAPTITSQDTVAQRVVRRDQITEGMAWLRIGIGAGVAIGAWLGGGLIDRYGAHAGLAVTIWSAVAVALVSLATIPWLRQGTEERADADEAPARPELGLGSVPPIA